MNLPLGQLLGKIWNSKFVVMFDESLNRSTNNKQMDLHIRYWAGDCVQSPYFGSHFLGHATAQDLLHNFMVSFMHAQSLIL